MARSIWKGPVTSLESALDKKINRASIISPSSIGRDLFVYNGKKKISSIY